MSSLLNFWLAIDKQQLRTKQQVRLGGRLLPGHLIWTRTGMVDSSRSNTRWTVAQLDCCTITAAASQLSSSRKVTHNLLCKFLFFVDSFLLTFHFFTLTDEDWAENALIGGSKPVPGAADHCERDRCVYQIVYKMKPAVFPLHTVASWHAPLNLISYFL